jgi:hypothetical protein
MNMGRQISVTGILKVQLNKNTRGKQFTKKHSALYMRTFSVIFLSLCL